VARRIAISGQQDFAGQHLPIKSATLSKEVPLDRQEDIARSRRVTRPSRSISRKARITVVRETSYCLESWASEGSFRPFSQVPSRIRAASTPLKWACFGIMLSEGESIDATAGC
jgi:hypothetical protein